MVLAVGDQRRRAAWALEAILAETPTIDLEILLVDVGLDRHAPLASATHSAVRLVRARRERPYGELLAGAVANASAPIVAFVEEHVLVQPDWAGALVRAHLRSCAAVCGEMWAGDVDRPAARLIELVSRNEWSPPARRGEALVLRWQNVSYKRDLLLRLGDRLPLYLSAEGELFRRLRADGYTLHIEPDAKMIHAHEVAWSDFLRGTYYSQRSAAAAEHALSGGGLIRRLVRTAAVTLGLIRWPVVLLRRLRRLPEPQIWVPFAVLNTHRVLQYYGTAWLGSVIGIWFGAGESSVRFLDYELNADRYTDRLAPGVGN